MRRLAALLLAAGTAAAAPASKPPVTVRMSEAVVDWLRVYPLTAYRETWTTTVEVRDADKDVPRVMRAIEKQGGKLAVPLQNSVISPSEGTRQLVYQLDDKQAAAALKALKKIGKFQPPVVRPIGEKLPVVEIEQKIAALTGDKERHAAELADMPAISALADAALSHLVAARDVARKVRTQVTLDLTVAVRKK